MNFAPLEAKSHDRKSFDCGVHDLNLYLQKVANQDQKRSLSRVYVLAENQTVIGYYSLSSHAVSRQFLPMEYNVGGYGDIPFLLLGRVAVDKTFQKQGFGDVLLVDACKRTHDLAKQVGIYGLLVETKDDVAASFYQSFGFSSLPGAKRRLVLPISQMALKF